MNIFSPATEFDLFQGQCKFFELITERINSEDGSSQEQMRWILRSDAAVVRLRLSVPRNPVLNGSAVSAASSKSSLDSNENRSPGPGNASKEKSETFKSCTPGGTLRLPPTQAAVMNPNGSIGSLHVQVLVRGTLKLLLLSPLLSPATTVQPVGENSVTFIGMSEGLCVNKNRYDAADDLDGFAALSPSESDSEVPPQQKQNANMNGNTTSSTVVVNKDSERTNFRLNLLSGDRRQLFLRYIQSVVSGGASSSSSGSQGSPSDSRHNANHVSNSAVPRGERGPSKSISAGSRQVQGAGKVNGPGCGVSISGSRGSAGSRSGASSKSSV